MDNVGQAKVKMSGYLHQKIKKRMMSSWKMYWFVLEDRLLLYYRSKEEYQAISPCKGSINLGPPCIVKSCPSMANAFQIQTRTSTITLRAENTEDQMKWMQAVMAALNQNQNFTTGAPKKLHHFRYSLDDLIPETEPGDNQIKKATLERQNTMPATVESSRSSSEIIQRLQKIGAHSYGGSLGAISKMSVKKCGSPTLLNREKTSENSQEECKIEPILRPVRELGDNIYERISGDSNSSQLSNRTSFIVDNDNYSVPLRKSSGKKDVRKEKSLLVENDHYATTKDFIATEKNINSVLIENDQYDATGNLPSTPKNTNSVLVENDQYGKSPLSPVENKHSILVDNDQYATIQNSSEEVIYAEPKINAVTDHNKNSVLVENSFYASRNITNNENLYEDLDIYDRYSQPVLKSEETSSQSSHDSKNKSRQNSKDAKEEKGKPKVKKTKSFIRRVWKKRSKKVDKQDSQEEDIYEEVDATVVEKTDMNNENTIQMLSELQNILEHKKTILKTSAGSYKDQPEDTQPDQASTSISDVCPSLPTKTRKHARHHDIPKSNQPVRSLDEILDDLDKEKLESKNKVKILIEKFSEPDDVILRKRDKSNFNTGRHSDDLNKLLDELAKVTSAPIMTPGVTSSLVTPNLTDEEWLKLLPVRRRRLSEPDYDIPRPHKSILLPVKHENSDAIPVTRFFGPVLPPTMSDNSPTKEDYVCTSMTPDSLEVEDHQKSTQFSYTSHNYYQLKPDESKDLKCFPHNYKEDDKIIYALPKSYLSVATHIVNTCHNICSPQIADDCTIIYKNVKNVDIHDEIFNDSLEFCNES